MATTNTPKRQSGGKSSLSGNKTPHQLDFYVKVGILTIVGIFALTLCITYFVVANNNPESIKGYWQDNNIIITGIFTTLGSMLGYLFGKKSKEE